MVGLTLPEHNHWQWAKTSATRSQQQIKDQMLLSWLWRHHWWNIACRKLYWGQYSGQSLSMANFHDVKKQIKNLRHTIPIIFVVYNSAMTWLTGFMKICLCTLKMVMFLMVTFISWSHAMKITIIDVRKEQDSLIKIISIINWNFHWFYIGIQIKQNHEKCSVGKNLSGSIEMQIFVARSEWHCNYTH